ncbi:MAG: hypothetical protein RR593_09715 [Hungatella sp.]
MYDYNVASSAGNNCFKQACKKIEESLPELKKNKLLIDVDGSLIQVYVKDGRKIKVFNDYEVDAVYVESDVEIDCLN